MRRWITTFMLLAALACPLWAGMPPTRAQVLLTQCPSHESLRASLLEYAHGAPRAERLPAGEAMFYAGLSYERAGRPDSAIACYRGAIERRGNNAERLALADALLRRARPDDLAAARALLDSTWARLPKLAKRISVSNGARLEARSIPPGVVTAYPRISKVHEDRAGGIASAEALCAASVFLGEPRLDLLNGYKWAHEFLRLNSWLPPGEN